MDHTHPEELLSAYMDHELGEEERLLVEAHLARCERCRALIGDWLALQLRVSERYDEMEAPLDMELRILGAIETIETFGALENPERKPKTLGALFTPAALAAAESPEALKPHETLHVFEAAAPSAAVSPAAAGPFAKAWLALPAAGITMLAAIWLLVGHILLKIGAGLFKLTVAGVYLFSHAMSSLPLLAGVSAVLLAGIVFVSGKSLRQLLNAPLGEEGG